MVLLMFTAVLYARSIGNGFVNLDDPLLVTENSHVTTVSLQNIGYVFTHFDPELYIPLTFLSYQAEAWTLGFGAWHFHFFNLLLHLGCITLVYAITLKLAKQKDIALLSSALFALHPANAETVLWISARKDLLCSFFSLAAWNAYLSYGQQEKRSTLFAIFGLLLLALFSKVTAVIMPFVFLLSDGYLGVHYTTKKLKKLLPSFALALLFGIVAIVGKTHILESESVSTLVLMAFRSTAFSLRMLLLPTGQSVMHFVHDPIGLASPIFAFSLLLVTVLTLIAWEMRKRIPAIAFGWGFFLLTLTPTFLLYSHGIESLVLGSERYLYLPSIGLFLIAASICHRLFRHAAISRPTRIVMGIGIVAILLCSAFLTEQRVNVFHNSITFNEDILKTEPHAARALYNLGLALEDAARPYEAESRYREALAANPAFALPAINLGILTAKEGRTEEGIAMLLKATEIDPTYFRGFFNLGITYQKLGRLDDAIAAYRKTIELFPDFPTPHQYLATVYGQKKMYREALAEYKILMTLDPAFREKLSEIGVRE